ncbi:hypothetical protein BC829DRAFT_448497 [Chytridium lagenaria]|nr:hypothetical protein BC829DRAFT_448497 [Chytridium lagenaria]
MNYLRDFNDSQRAGAPKWHISDTSYVIEEAPREPSRPSHVFSNFLQRFSTASDCSRTAYSPSPRPSFGEAFKRLSTAIKRSSKDANVAEHETENPAKKIKSTKPYQALESISASGAVF